jgi:acetylornithine deacetylase/succinyl-diaminopimelate desuccinylase-like protein
MDRRLLPDETREQAIVEIREILDQFSRDVEPLDYELHSEGNVASNVNTDPDNPFVKTADDALTDLVTERRPMIGYPQTSDGRWFAGDHAPIIHFGPGDPALAHTTDEHVQVQQLVEGARFLALLALRWRGI